MSSLWYITADGWHYPEEADRRFNRIVAVALALFVIIGVIVPLLELTGLTEGGGDTIETRYVNLLPDAEVAPQVEEPVPAPEEQPKPEEPKAVKPVEAPPKPQVSAEEQQQRAVERARDTAARSGVMAFADQLQALRSDVTALERADKTLQSVGATQNSDSESNTFDQAVASTSGGIGSPTGTGATRRTQSGAGLGTRRTTTVQSPVGFGQDRSKPGQGGDKLIAGRTLEEIQLVFDRNKGAITSIYNRAARDNPNLSAGKIVISLTIAPSGAVTDCKLVSSTFNDPELERKIIARVMLMNFGAKDVPQYTYPNYPIHFLPS